MDKTKILFVCLGNICRSPAAQGILQAIVDEKGLADQFYIDSAGTGNYHIGDLPDHRMRIHARRRGLELTHRCRQVRVSDFDEFDIIVAMDDYNLRDLRRLAPSPEAEAKVVPMGKYLTNTVFDYIPDPYYDGAEGFERVLDLLQEGCNVMLTELTQ